MRYPDGHKEAMRANILELAARALRRDGLSGVSIPGLMKAAGLTHGGFYGYFESRDELVGQAILLAAQQTGARVLSEEVGGLTAMLAGYLSEEHVNHPELGCVVAALGTEAPKQAAPVRRAFAEAARGLLRAVDKHIAPRRRGAAVTDEGLRLAAQMVGAVILARLVDDGALARRLLAAARQSPG